MWVAFCTVTNFQFGNILSPNTRICKKETLIGCKTVNCFEMLLCCSIFKSLITYLQTTMVSKVFAQCKTTIRIEIRQHFNIREEVGIHIGTLFKPFCISGSPPIFHISAVIILSTLIVKPVRHLMTDNHTDSTIIKCLVSLRIEERTLKNTGGETNFVGCWIVISVYRLRSHIPFIAVNRFSGFFLNMPIMREIATRHYVFIIRFLWVDNQLSVINPFVRISNFYIKFIQLFMCGSLRRVAHPRLCIDALPQRNLQIAYQLFHHLLRRLGEISCHINLAQRLSHLCFHLIGSAFPQRIILFSAAHCFAEEVEVSFANFIAQIRGRILNNIPFHQCAQVVGRSCGINFIISRHKRRLSHYYFLNISRLYPFGISHFFEWNIGV